MAIQKPHKSSQALLWRVIGSFPDSVKCYFELKIINSDLFQYLIHAVLFYHIFFHCLSSFRNRYCFGCGLVMAGFVDITTASLGSLAIAALAGLIKAGKTLVDAAWEKTVWQLA